MPPTVAKSPPVTGVIGATVLWVGTGISVVPGAPPPITLAGEPEGKTAAHNAGLNPACVAVAEGTGVFATLAVPDVEVTLTVLVESAQAAKNRVQIARIARNVVLYLDRIGLPPWGENRLNNGMHRSILLLSSENASATLFSPCAMRGCTEMLGHSDISITLGIYRHVTPRMQQSAVDAMDSLLG